MIFSDSIVALSSGRLPAGVAVIRISGPHSRFAIETIAGSIPADRAAAYRSLHAADGRLLDRALVLFFAAPRSFTGEDVAEFHVHGGRAVVAAVLAALTALDGVRSAEAGEFTQRAFLNGKIDLTEAEALADLISAETEAQRRFASLNAGGAQSRLYQDWRRRLIHARAMIEAEIDFTDEEDIPDSIAETIWADMGMLASDITRHMDGFAAADILREGFDVVILGAPNAGKSSLFNALARRDVAIVTDEPGTTRDLLEVALDLHGLRVRVTDTAGLRRTTGKVEALGIEKAKARGREADLVLALEDSTQPVPVDVDGIAILRVGTKSDLLAQMSSDVSARYDLCVSAVTGAGLDVLLEEIARRAEVRIDAAGEILPSRQRHVELLREAVRHIQASVGVEQALELRAEELRLAADRLGRVVGAVDVEDLLDVIFSQFCVGK
jgi:tRNA modification GTPase